MSSIRLVQKRNILGFLLAICLMVMSAAPNTYATHWRWWHHNRAHHHSKITGGVVGGAIGAAGGALVGGGKGALIGGAAGAGTGALVQHVRNVRHRHHHYPR